MRSVRGSIDVPVAALLGFGDGGVLLLLDGDVFVALAPHRRPQRLPGLLAGLVYVLLIDAVQFEVRWLRASVVVGVAHLLDIEASMETRAFSSCVTGSGNWRRWCQS